MVAELRVAVLLAIMATPFLECSCNCDTEVSMPKKELQRQVMGGEQKGKKEKQVEKAMMLRFMLARFFGEDVPFVGENVPSIGVNLPSMGDNVPSVGKNVPSVGKNVPSVGKNVPSMGKKIAVTEKVVHNKQRFRLHGNNFYFNYRKVLPFIG